MIYVPVALYVYVWLRYVVVDFTLPVAVAFTLRFVALRSVGCYHRVDLIYVAFTLRYHVGLLFVALFTFVYVAVTVAPLLRCGYVGYLLPVVRLPPHTVILPVGYPFLRCVYVDCVDYVPTLDLHVYFCRLIYGLYIAFCTLDYLTHTTFTLRLHFIF